MKSPDTGRSMEQIACERFAGRPRKKRSARLINRAGFLDFTGSISLRRQILRPGGAREA